MNSNKNKADEFARVVLAYSHKNPSYCLNNHIDFSACSQFFKMLDYSYTETFIYDGIYTPEVLLNNAATYESFPKDPKAREKLLKYLQKLVEEFNAREVSLEEVEHARMELEKCALEFRMQESAKAALTIANSDDVSVEEKASAIEKIALTTATPISRQKVSNYGRGMLGMIERFSEEKKNASGSNILPSKFIRVSNAITGYRKGFFTIIAGRPSAGKTTFLLQECVNLAREGYRGILFSIEMGTEDVFRSTIQFETGYSSNDYMSFHEPACGWDTIKSLAEGLSHTSLEVVDASSFTTQDILSHINRYERMVGKLDFVAIDYIQKIKPQNPRLNPVEALAEISNDLREIFKRKHIAGLVAAQFNRDGGTGEKPRLSDIKGSGSIEQDAAYVLGIHRQYLYNREDYTLSGEADLLVLKGRFGFRGDIKLGWRTDRGCFTQDPINTITGNGTTYQVLPPEKDEEETHPF